MHRGSHRGRARSARHRARRPPVPCPRRWAAERAASASRSAQSEAVRPRDGIPSRPSNQTGTRPCASARPSARCEWLASRIAAARPKRRSVCRERRSLELDQGDSGHRKQEIRARPDRLGRPRSTPAARSPRGSPVPSAAPTRSRRASRRHRTPATTRRCSNGRCRGAGAEAGRSRAPGHRSRA